MTSTKFWETKTLEEMSHSEWEQLCDRCGRCCLHKLEDEDSGRVFYTGVACRYLDPATARCSNYGERKHLVPDCLSVSRDLADDCYTWLPKTCAYRRLAEGRGLARWHPLVSGRAETVMEAGISVAGRVISDEGVNDEQMEEHIIHWVRF